MIGTYTLPLCRKAVDHLAIRGMNICSVMSTIQIARQCGAFTRCIAHPPSVPRYLNVSDAVAFMVPPGFDQNTEHRQGMS